MDVGDNLRLVSRAVERSGRDRQQLTFERLPLHGSLEWMWFHVQLTTVNETEIPMSGRWARNVSHAIPDWRGIEPDGIRIVVIRPRSH